MFDATIANILQSIWPMLVIFLIIISSLRIAYIIKNKVKVVFYREILSLGFIIYIMCLFHVVTFQDVSWSTSNFIPFKEMFRYELFSKMFFKNVIGNMIMFMPYGFFISYILKVEKKNLTFWLCLLTSCTIEVIQLLIGRVFDVDDIMLNIVGGMVGYYIYRLVYIIREKLPRFLKNQIFCED